MQQKFYLADGHCDTATVLNPLDLTYGKSSSQLDLPRFLTLGDLQFFAFFIKNDLPVPKLKTKLQKHIRDFYFALDLLENKNKIMILRQGVQLDFCHDNKIAVLALEGADLLEGDVAERDHFLQWLFSKGFRSMGLFWNNNNWVGCGANSNLQSDDTGLSQEGKSFVEYLASHNWLVDLAHGSRQSFWQSVDILTAFKKPMIVTHSCCNGLCNHKRNLDDNQIRKIGEMGGIMGITFVPSFLATKPNSADIFTVAEHIKYSTNLAGVDAVALGSDFDGTDDLPKGIAGYEDLPKLADALEKQGFNHQEISKIMGQNWKSFLRHNL